MNKTDKIRRKITSQICRMILWIDEEILPKDTGALGDKYRNFFYPISQDLQEGGYLVHLHPFQQSTSNTDDFDDPLSEPSPSLNSACDLSNKADVVILDWHLGYQDSPEHSVKILENLLANQGTRFVLILSKKSDDFRSEMEKRNLNADGKFSEIPCTEFPSWTSASGTHIALLSKTPDGNNNITAQEILEAVYSLISHAYPDYLHWAALEIAAKFRLHFPKWLNDLPTGTDIAVMQELLHEHTEIRDYLPENLLGDFVEIAKARQLESLLPANSQRDDWKSSPVEVSIPQQPKVQKILNVEQAAPSLDTNLLKQCIKHGSSCEWLNSHHSFVEFCEVSSNSAPSQTPIPGALYKKSDGDESIYICASQACDCARKSILLLLKAEATEQTKSGSTSLRHQNKTYRFDSTAENLVQVTVSESKDDRAIDGYSKIGQLRPPIAARIISRFWAGNTRPAVNHPNFARVLRKGE